jgi:hypothetical protein
MSIPELLPDEERRLFAVVVNHEREAKANRCRCGLPWPCPVRQDARDQLAATGIDLDQALGTIWSDR